jgi:hypothetical protein
MPANVTNDTSQRRRRHAPKGIADFMYACIAGAFSASAAAAGRA